MNFSKISIAICSGLSISTALSASTPPMTLPARGEPTAAPILITRIITTVETVTPTSTNPPIPPTPNPLADLDPARPTRGLAFAIQRYSDTDCTHPIGPRFAYDANQRNSCFFRKKHCKGSCGYLDHDEFGAARWRNHKGTLPKTLLEQYEFGSWDYRLVAYEDVWNPANKDKMPRDKIMFNEVARTGTQVCVASFFRNRACKVKRNQREEGVVGRWKPTNLRVDEGRCMGGFKTRKGVEAKAQSLRIQCWD